MGTRNLTVVINDGKICVAQYGQCDGYPTGQGNVITTFLNKKKNILNLKKNLKKTRFLEIDGKDKEFIDSYNKNVPEWSNQPDNRTPKQKHWAKTYLSRDIGGDILNNISNSTDDEIILKNSLNFAGASLFCEWGYVVDLDNEILEVYQGFNRTPLLSSDRFYNLPLKKQSHDETPYYQIKLIKKYKFIELNKNSMEELEKALEEAEEAEAGAK